MQESFTLRTAIGSRVPAIAILGLAIIAPRASHAGPEPICDIECNLVKLCSVGGGPPQSACTTVVGDEVTYIYQVDSSGHPARVDDDKLGLIGYTSGGTLTKAAMLIETTTNRAGITATDGCFCAFGIPAASLTVTLEPPPETPSPTPTATPTPTPSATPTATPRTCTTDHPIMNIVTLGKGQSPANNQKVYHSITGYLVNADSLSSTAHRIEVCAGTAVTAAVIDTTGTPTNTALGSLTCNASMCSGVVNATEKYRSVSQDGRDTDRITFIPK